MREDAVSQSSVLLELSLSGGMDGNPARLVKFGLAHFQKALLQVHIAPVQTERLAQTHACNRQQPEERRVGGGPHPFGRRDLLGGFD